ncbi:uncharacterized protein BDR25DRAFT_364125, partial [Lindgomyces ingoldianus]
RKRTADDELSPNTPKPQPQPRSRRAANNMPPTKDTELVEPGDDDLGDPDNTANGKVKKSTGGAVEAMEALEAAEARAGLPLIWYEYFCLASVTLATNVPTSNVIAEDFHVISGKVGVRCRPWNYPKELREGVFRHKYRGVPRGEQAKIFLLLTTALSLRQIANVSGNCKAGCPRTGQYGLT